MKIENIHFISSLKSNIYYIHKKRQEKDNLHQYTVTLRV
jgi:hypothetical protein